MDAWNTSLDKSRGQTDLIQIVSVSTHEPNLEHVRQACLARWKDASFKHLSTKESAINFAQSVLGSADSDKPDIIFLDLDASPEESWSFLEQVDGLTDTSSMLRIGLALPREGEDAARRFGNMVTTVLPLPGRGSQAEILIELIDQSWIDQTE